MGIIRSLVLKEGCSKRHEGKLTCSSIERAPGLAGDSLPVAGRIQEWWMWCAGWRVSYLDIQRKGGARSTPRKGATLPCVMCDVS